MTAKHYHGVCRGYHGRMVEVKTNDGQIYRGRIENVDGDHVYLQPMRDFCGLGYGFLFRRYEPYRIVLGTIAALALIPLFFW